MYFWCSKALSHRDGSLEYPQHMFWLRNKKNNFQLRTLIWGPDVTAGQLNANYGPKLMSEFPKCHFDSIILNLVKLCLFSI